MSLAITRASLPLAGYLVSGGLSNLGNALSGIVYPWLVYDLTQSAVAMGIVAFVTLAPLVVGSFFGSLLVDRLGARAIALAADGLSALTTLGAAALHVAGLLTIEVLLMLALAGSLLDGPGMVAHDARLPEMARMAATPLTRANLLDDLIDNGAQLAGPLLAGLALAFGGSAAGLMILAGFSGFAFATTLLTMPRFRARRGGDPVTVAECLAGPAFILRNRDLRAPLLLTALGMAVFIAVEAIVLPAILRTAGRPATDLSLFLGGSAAGAIAINVMLLALRQVPRTSAIFPFAFAGFGLALAALALDLSQLTLVLAGAMLGISAGPLTPLLQTMLQTVPPKAIRARVLGSALGLAVVASPVSVLLAGWAVDALGAAATLWSAAAICAAAAIAALGLADTSGRSAPRAKAEPRATAAGQAAPAMLRRALARSSGRVSLARLSLIYEWKRYLAAVLAVAFAGLLLIVQLGLLLGMFATVTVIVDKASADLWVVGQRTQSFDLAREMPARVEMRLLAHPQVASVQTMNSTSGDWRRPDGGAVVVYATGLDVRPESLSMPSTFGLEQRRAIEPLGHVIVDEIDLEKLGVKVGETAEINRRRVTVAATTTGMRAIGGANVFASQATVRWLAGEGGSSNSAYYLIRVLPGADVAQVRAELQTAAGSLDYQVMRPGELSVMSQSYWLLESGSGAGFLFATILGLLVGVAITSQTLRAAVLSALREYATLRALGVSVARLRAVVIEQSAWIGLAGLCFAGALTGCVYLAATTAGVAVQFPWWSLAMTSAFTLLVALLSGYLSLKPLYATEPAELLR